MKVKELKKLLELPSNISQEDFDNLEVLVFNSETEDIKNCDFEESGFSIFSGNCDEEGNLIGEDYKSEKYDYPTFLIKY